MKKIKNRIYISLFIIIGIIFSYSIVNAKYVIEKQFTIANLNIDRTKPIIQIINIDNNNTGYEKYANKTNTIKIQIKIIEKNIKQINIDNKHIKFKINDKYIQNSSIKINKLKQDEEIYEIRLNNLTENGKLYIEIIEKTVVDLGGLTNDYMKIDTEITIDNIIPTGIFTEKNIEDGKVNGIIDLSEKIRTLEGWKLNENETRIEKEFTNNISYQLPIVDLAGNRGIVEINITKATNINIVYASHNSNVGWTFGYGNYDVAGKDAVKQNRKFKTEALAFNISGNIDSDFVQARAYVYTHWGDGSYGKCSTSGILYKHGYNPNSTSYKSMKSNDLIEINGKKYFQLGGAGINALHQTDINGNNPVPPSTEYVYGISKINLNLKDYSYYSIVYQVLVDNIGWLSSCSDGEECGYNNNNKPISAFRVALIPKTEKQYVIETWNKDVGTFNVK